MSASTVAELFDCCVFVAGTTAGGFAASDISCEESLIPGNNGGEFADEFTAAMFNSAHTELWVKLFRSSNLESIYSGPYADDYPNRTRGDVLGGRGRSGPKSTFIPGSLHAIIKGRQSTSVHRNKCANSFRGRDLAPNFLRENRRDQGRGWVSCTQITSLIKQAMS